MFVDLPCALAHVTVLLGRGAVCSGRCVVLLALLSVVLCVADARADDTAGAQQHFQRAIALYDEQAYDAALVEFQRAYDSAPNYRVLFNIAQVHFQRHEFAEAQKMFARYLAEGGDEIAPERRQFVQHELMVLSERVGSLSVLTNVPGARVVLDDVPVGVTPLHDLTVDIGRHMLRVELEHYRSITGRMHIASGQREELRFVLDAEAPVAAQAGQEEQPPHQADRQRMVRWVLGGSALALGVGAAISGGLALARDNELDRLLKKVPADRSAIAHQRTRVHRAARTGDVLGAAAVASAVGLLVTWLSTREADPSEASTRSRARLDVGLGTLALDVAF